MKSKYIIEKNFSAFPIALSVYFAVIGFWVFNVQADSKIQNVSQTQITGLELGIEGAETAIQGSTLKLFFTMYEVVDDKDLRPARFGNIKILTSFKPDDVEAVLKTDTNGRASADISVPEDVDDFEITIETSLGALRRSFSMPVAVSSPIRIELVADRNAVQPGETVTFIGRAVSEISGRPIAFQPVRIAVTDQDGRSLQDKRTIKTSEAGVFLVTSKAPSNAAELRLKADIESICNATASVSIKRREAPLLVVTAAPQKTLVQIGSKVRVEVTVRRSDGRPVKGADVRFTEEALEPKDDKAKNADRKEKEIKTDENGFATLFWTIPRSYVNGSNAVGKIWAERAGLGKASTEFAVRAMSNEPQIGVSVEGGDLLPGLPSRLYVRAVNADGKPLQKTSVVIASSVTGKHKAKTDADGIAVFEVVPKIKVGIEGEDRCGGVTASSLKIKVGDEPSDQDESYEENEYEERCVPIDLDGAVRVRPSKVLLKIGETFDVKLHLKDDAASYPVELALLKSVEPWTGFGTSNNNANIELIPIMQQIVRGVSAVRNAKITLPTNLYGEFVLRARPLIGPSSTPVRGGVSSVFVIPNKPIEISASFENSAVHISSANPEDGAESSAFIVPMNEAENFVSRLEEQMIPAFDRYLKDIYSNGGKLLEALAAACTLRDDAAPAVLRDKSVTVMPGMQNPSSFGILRDPVRARARFVKGRIALAVRTLEARLEELIPDRVNDIGFAAPDKHRFNAEALNAVKGFNYLQGIDLMTLSGAPMSLKDLENMDASFTFDNVAARVTRKHLLSLLIQLRSFVRKRNLDLRVEGQDPTRWLDVLFEQYSDEEYTENYDYSDEDGDIPLNPKCIFDGWGRRMAIIRTKKGDSARFGFLQPLPPGFELSSAGPDGIFGTPDDMADPFARVLPKGTMYAEAAGEDELIARLTQIEIDRATLDAVSELFNESMASYDLYNELQGVEDEPLRGMGEFRVKSDFESNIYPIRQFERSWRSIKRSKPTLGSMGEKLSVPFEVDDEPRTWSVIALTWTKDGRTGITRRDFNSGFPAILDMLPITRLTSKEMLTISAAGALLPGESTEQNVLNGLSISVEGAGAVDAKFENGAKEEPILVGPAGGFEKRIRLSAKQEGPGKVTVTVSDSKGVGRRVETLPISVLRSGLLRQSKVTSAVTKTTWLQLNIPNDAIKPEGELILMGPDAMQNDPSLDLWKQKDPALVAWALTMAGRPIPDDLLRRMEQVTERDGHVNGKNLFISTACAAAAWAAVSNTEVFWASEATARAVTEIFEEQKKKNTLNSELLAALSITTASNDTSPLGQMIQTIQDNLRSSVKRNRNNPWVLSRGAAALLLADNRDIRGKLMLTLAKEYLETAFNGGRTVNVRSDKEKGVIPLRKGARQIQATAALAIAAHQVGDNELALELAKGVAAEAGTALSLGGETLFWWLAARSFGVFGIIGDKKTIETDIIIGKHPSQKLMLGQNPVIITLSKLAPKDSIDIRVEPKPESGVVPLVSVASTYVRPAKQLNLGTLSADLSGDAGFAGERSAYIATVTNSGGTSVSHPMLLIDLPSGAELDNEAKRAMQQTDGVLTVSDPDSRGTVRVRFKPIKKGEKVQIPLAVIWSAAGRRKGIALTAFPEDKSWELSVMPPQEINVPFRPEDAF